MSAPLLEVRDLRVHHALRQGLLGRVKQRVQAVDGVSFELAAGETLALVGESGCGKTTLARAILRLGPTPSGQVRFEGRDLVGLPAAGMRAVRRSLQMVFQDPLQSLDPRLSVGQSVAEPLEALGLARGAEARRRTAELLERVGIPPAHADRLPHEFSGGQLQRIAIARALAPGPRLLVLDEPVSALDLSVRAQVLALLRDLQRETGMAYLFVSHDLSLVARFAARVAVMHLGRIVETAGTAELFRDPRHPYTRALIASIPSGDPAHRRGAAPLAGEPPSPVSPPAGCRFHTRCPLLSASPDARCASEDPASRVLPEGRSVACHQA